METVVRYLRPHLAGRTITSFRARWPKVTAPLAPEVFARQVTGHTIQAVHRRGKYVLLGLDSGYVHLHLRMTGRLAVAPSGETDAQPYITAEFDLSGGSRLTFSDMRKFGRVGYLGDLAPLEAGLGPEPLSPRFTPRLFHRMLQARRRRVKSLLLDQAFIAGLGNIYVDEALFLARIHPEIQAHKLTFARVKALHQAIQAVLRASINEGGTTIINFGYGTSGRGRFREMLQVFRREGEPCPVCNTPVVKIRVAQRGTYLCPTCQTHPG